MSLKATLALPAALALGLIASAASAQGAPEDQARIHFDQGLKLYEDGEYEQAAIAFARAYEIAPSYKILFNIGQAEAELKHYALALDAFTRYLAQGGDEVPPERVTLVRSEIERLNALVGMIAVDCPVEGAKIKVDNESKGTTPLAGAIFVDIGKHEVVITRGQDELLREVVRVAGGQTVTLEIEGDGAVEPVTGGGGEPDAPDDDGKGRVWTWVALGVGAAAGIAGGAIGGAAMAKRSDLEAECEGNHCPPSSQGEADTITTMNLTADILYGVAGAAIVTGVILFFVEPRDAPEREVAIAPAITAGGAGLAVGGRF